VRLDPITLRLEDTCIFKEWVGSKVTKLIDQSIKPLNLYFFQFVKAFLNESLRKSITLPVMLGGHSGLDPPLPISNRAVKRTCANDSMLFACESRSLPSYLFEKPH
jgi:hypothetical protein